MIPTRVPGAPTARSAPTAIPCETSRWCDARSAVTQSRMPGALTPSACPRNATTHGSLWVIQSLTTSPSCSPISAAYSAKRSAVSRAAQPPAAWRALGRSQWFERRHRLDAALEQPLDEPPVERHAAPVQPPAPVGLHPRPRDREAVRLEPQRRHQVEIAAPAVVVVAGDLAASPRRPPARAARRSRPRSTARARPRARRPRSGTPRSRRRTGSSLHRPGGQPAHEPALGEEEREQHRDRRDDARPPSAARTPASSCR